MKKTFEKSSLVDELRRESKSLGIPAGSAEIIIQKVIENICPWLEERSIVTKSDLERVVSLELDKYNSDLAYIYRNRGKII